MILIPLGEAWYDKSQPMRRGPKPKLERLFDELKAKRDAGCDITTEFLRQEYSLTTGGVSCFLYMLSHDKFHPELKPLIQQTELTPLRKKDEAKQPMVKFLEEMPPYKKEHLYFEEELTAKELAIYFSMGVVRRAAYEEYRQIIIAIYVALASKIAVWKLDILEALNHGDTEFFNGEFKERPESEIRQHLKTVGLKRDQIQSVIKIIRSN